MVRPGSFSQSQSSLRRQQGASTTSSPQFEALFSVENRSQFWRWGGAVVALLLVVLFFFAYRQHQIASALKSLHDGIAAMQSGKVEEAIPYLEKAQMQVGADTVEEQLARLYLTEAYLQSGKFEEAKKILETRRHPTGDSAYLSQMLWLMEGRNAEEQNDLQAARRAYEEAATLEGPFAEDALFALARVAETTGDNTAASAARDKFLVTFPNSPFVELLRQKLGK